ncbi:hypothetical protein TrCOL_g8425 [Triparma columacea]|uniref:Rab-GAP TBC domain-containing protein n=1 Tax=Triparma columacea TaxID=722753 RepID=A0A9W7LC93_9STRA|nr:hypothetical protein TrCOL_g8425 [Triparma columacea]
MYIKSSSSPHSSPHPSQPSSQSQLRVEAWRALCDVDNTLPSSTSLHELSPETVSQVRRDVERSLWNLLPETTKRLGLDNEGEEVSKRARTRAKLSLKKRRESLNALILSYLRHSGSHYYQGLHDVAGVVSLVHSGCTPSALKVLLRMGQSWMSVPSRSDFGPLISAVKHTIYPLLLKFDKPLHKHITEMGVEPFFVVPWVLTFFTHSSRSLSSAARLLDVAVASHQAFVLFMCVAAVVEEREHVLGTKGMCVDEGHAECHKRLCEVSERIEEGGKWQGVVERAIEYIKKVPPMKIGRGKEGGVYWEVPGEWAVRGKGEAMWARRKGGGRKGKRRNRKRMELVMDEGIKGERGEGGEIKARIAAGQEGGRDKRGVTQFAIAVAIAAVIAGITVAQSTTL